jgi:hypothetical protein
MDEQIQGVQVYEDFAVEYRAAYAKFVEIYTDKHPQPALASADWSDWIIASGVSVIVIASVVVSGSRTIAEFGGGFVGIMAFLMLECAVVAFAFLHTKNNINDARVSDVSKLTKRGMWLALIVAVVANIHATLRVNGVISIEWINVVILLMVAVSAPLLAYISGDIAGLEYMRAINRHKRVDEQNRAAMDEWRAGLNRAWGTQQSRWGVGIERLSVQRQTDALPQLSVRSDNGQTDNGQTQRAGYGHQRTSDGQAKVIAYLNEHKSDASLSSRELARVIGVGHDTANKGRNAWRKMQKEKNS